jgi:hypothetical protein
VSNRNRSFPSGRVTLYEAGSKVVSSASNNGNPLSETTLFRSPTRNKVPIDCAKDSCGEVIAFH